MDAQSPPPCETFNTSPLIRATTAIEFVLSFILSSLHSLGLVILSFRFGLLADIQYTPTSDGPLNLSKPSQRIGSPTSSH